MKVKKTKRPARVAPRKGSKAPLPGKRPALSKRPANSSKRTGDVQLPCRFVKLGGSFGFAAPIDGSGDVFIPGRDLFGAMPGDTVEVRLFRSPRVKDSREGAVERILEPNNRVVGTVVYQNGCEMVAPDHIRDFYLYIKPGSENGARVGERVMAEIVERGRRHEEHRVAILQRYPAADTASQASELIVYAAGLRTDFTPEVLAQAQRVSRQKLEDPTRSGRTDLRRVPIFTIDSASTKDIDDAISAKKTKNGYELGVHIADVSHYVEAKSVLDKEAFERGTSVYYAASVLPMLPKELSNGICSLNPQEDRYAFSCILQLDNNADLVGYTFKKSIIRSRVKGVYAEINRIFAGAADGELQEKYKEVAEQLPLMREIYDKLTAARAARGCMEIESDEPELVLDEQGRCVGVRRRERGEAERMIEEFMLLANGAAARLAREKSLPFVYRVHDKPSAEKVAQLEQVLKAANVDFKFKGDAPTQRELAQLLDKTRGTNLMYWVHKGVLRSMAKAKYEPEPKGHYGLALHDYAHFTSPIRRYPDLAIHRILSDYVGGMPAKELQKKYKEFAGTASQHSSETELTAQRVERDCDDCYKAEYMRQNIGQVMEGIISSVMQFGIYVELPNSVEGMIHVSKLPKGPVQLSEGICLTNTLTGQSWRIGDKVQVLVDGVDIGQGNVDFSLADMPQS